MAPIPRIGDDTRERWLVRDVPREALEDFLNAAAELGWTLSEAYTIQEGEPPTTPEVMRVWCQAELPKRIIVRNAKVKTPQPSE